MAGVATEKPGSHPYPEGVFCIPLFLLAEQKPKHDTIYLFSETWRGYREAEDSDGSFLNTWFPYLMTITFQCFSCGSKVSYRKALVCLHKELSLCVNVKYFDVLEWVFVWGG